MSFVISNLDPTKKESLASRSQLEENSSLKNMLGPGTTLTDITEFLIKEDLMLQRTITKSQESFSSLNLQLNDLSMELKKAGSLKPQV